MAKLPPEAENVLTVLRKWMESRESWHTDKSELKKHDEDNWMVEVDKAFAAYEQSKVNGDPTSIVH